MTAQELHQDKQEMDISYPLPLKSLVSLHLSLESQG